MAKERGFLGNVWHFVLKLTALVVYLVCIRTYTVVVKLAAPFLTYFTGIYQSIDLDSVDPLYVLQTFLKWALMVTAYVWQWVKWVAGKVVDIIPGGRWLEEEVKKIIEQVDHEYRFLVRPLDLGLFSRKVNGSEGREPLD